MSHPEGVCPYVSRERTQQVTTQKNPNSPNRSENGDRSRDSDTASSFFAEPVRGIVDLIQLIRQLTPPEKLVHGLLPAGPVAVIIKRNKAPRDHPIVESFEAQLHRFIPIRVNIQDCDFLYRDGWKRVLK